MSNEDQNALNKVVGYVLGIRDSDRGAAARIRAGLTPHTEARAFADILPLLGDVPKLQETAYLRSAALIASHPSIGQIGYVPSKVESADTQPDVDKSQTSYISIGRSLRQISTAIARSRKAENPAQVDPANPDGIALRLAQLPDQNLDSATLTFNRILDLGDGLGIDINYFDLTKTLLYWGYGNTQASIETRKRPLRDYYRFNPSLTKKADK